MTTREKLKKVLTDNGMFPEQAEEVLARAIPEIEKLTPNYQITWDSPAEEYPNAVYVTMWLTLKPIALAWIDEKLPRAWFRPMFV